MVGDKKRVVFLICITIICILALVEAVYIYTFSPDGTISGVGNNELVVPEIDEKEKLKEQFSSIFKNDLISNIDTNGIYKKNNKHNLVYTDYNKVDRVNGEYEIDVQIPHINIESERINNINNEIDKIFKVKAEAIVEGNKEQEEATVYNVKYKAYINNNILSLIIQCTLKENDSAQKILIKTYCYNIITDKIVTFDEIAKMRKINKKDVESEIKSEIESQILMEKTLKEAGYVVFSRNIESAMYKYDNIKTFFMDNEDNLYVIFAYGNNNNTSEVDLVIF